MRNLIIAAIAFAGVLGAPRRMDAQESPLSRFGVADQLVLADSGEMTFVGTPPNISFGRRGTPVSVSFLLVYVVDTLGKVELPSVSFGSDVDDVIRKATCRTLGEMTYRPVIRGGVLRRALVVQPISLWRTDGPAPARVFPEPLRAAVRDGGIVETLPLFAKQPHCE